MKNYIVNNKDDTNMMYSEHAEIHDKLAQTENNIKFLDVYLRKSILKLEKIEKNLNDTQQLLSDDFNNLNNKYNKLCKWISIPWWKRIFISKKKFLQ